MKFTFVNKSSCCGSQNTTLQTTGYPIDAANPAKSLTQALDRFYTNYRVSPIGVTLSDEELNILQRGLPSSDFSIVDGLMRLRKLPITVVKTLA
jgi:hypothetical protein